MVRLDEIFTMVNGVAATSLSISEIKEDEMVSFRRPSKTFKGTMAGFVNRSDVASDKIFPKDTIMVSTDGEGSHTYSYVVNGEFVPNSNVCALIPKVELTLREKIFYAKCITMNRPLFSYGRKPKGDRLARLQIPSQKDIPSWVYDMEINDYSDISESKNQEKVSLPPVSDWKTFTYEDLFTIVKGRGPTATAAKKNPGNTPYIGASAQNNGITHYSSHTPEHNGNVITIATDGSVGECFYQDKAFNATSNIAVLSLVNKEMNCQVGLFLASLIKKERFKFNYGRKWNLVRMKKSTIKVPVDQNGKIDTELITKYINSLSYSKYL